MEYGNFGDCNGWSTVTLETATDVVRYHWRLQLAEYGNTGDCNGWGTVALETAMDGVR